MQSNQFFQWQSVYSSQRFTHKRGSSCSRIVLGAVAPVLAMTGFFAFSLVSTSLHAASSFQDSGGFLVMEAEDFDLNFTQSDGFYQFDNLYPIAYVEDYYSGWGYMKGLYNGGTDMNLSPRMDFKVNFTTAGIWYIWVLGSDMGGKALSMGLDGVVPASAGFISGPDAVFGTRNTGALDWNGTNNTGGGYNVQAYLTVPTAGDHTINVFIREPGLYLDRFCLTTNSWDSFVPIPTEGGTNSGLNVPAQETLAPAASLAAALTQPANNQVLYGGSNTPVTLSAKAFTNGTAVSKMEFFSKLASASTYTKIGEATAKPYMYTWTNSPIGTNNLRAVVTDSLNNKATGAVVTVIRALPIPGTPLVWETNKFDTGLGSFTIQGNNHDGAFDFGWLNSTNAGGTAGELGGKFVRRLEYVAYVAEPLFRPVALNEELWFYGSMMLTNSVKGNNDIFLGYFDTVSGNRMGLKIREPSSEPAGNFRFSVEPNGVKLTQQLPSGTLDRFELHWVPFTNYDGTVDGSGDLSGTVAGVPFDVTYSAPNGSTFNAFGLLAPTQGSTDTNIYYYAYFDNLEYRVPQVPLLNIQLIPGSKALLSWGVTNFILQYRDGAIVGSPWTDNSSTVVQVGNTWYVTNTVGSNPKFYRLRSQ